MGIFMTRWQQAVSSKEILSDATENARAIMSLVERELVEDLVALGRFGLNVKRSPHAIMLSMPGSSKDLNIALTLVGKTASESSYIVEEWTRGGPPEDVPDTLSLEQMADRVLAWAGLPH